jgi:hypothetical protein
MTDYKMSEAEQKRRVDNMTLMNLEVIILLQLKETPHDHDLQVKASQLNNYFRHGLPLPRQYDAYRGNKL